MQIRYYTFQYVVLKNLNKYNFIQVMQTLTFKKTTVKILIGFL